MRRSRSISVASFVAALFGVRCAFCMECDDAAMSSEPVAGVPFSRLVSFSDGVVAVAVTVMVLPIVDIAGPSDGAGLLDVFSEHAGLLSAYFLTFYVVLSMWLAHHRTFDGMRAYDHVVFWLNGAWLATIALMPWPASLLGANGSGGGIGTFYWATLAVNSLMLQLISLRVVRRPELLEPGIARAGRIGSRGPMFTATFLFLAVVSALAPSVANGSAWLVIVAVSVVARLRGRRGQDSSAR